MVIFCRPINSNLRVDYSAIVDGHQMSFLSSLVVFSMQRLIPFFQEDICTRLWCLYKGTCRTRLHSAVPGTECAPGKVGRKFQTHF